MRGAWHSAEVGLLQRCSCVACVAQVHGRIGGAVIAVGATVTAGRHKLIEALARCRKAGPQDMGMSHETGGQHLVVWSQRAPLAGS